MIDMGAEKDYNRFDEKRKGDKGYLLTYLRHLEKRLRNLETEKQLLDAERLRLEQELHSLRNEIDRLREPPLVGGIIISVIDKQKGRYAVRASTGPFFVVKAREKLKDELKIGTFVALNQRTFAIIEILEVDLEDYKRFSRVIYTGQNLLEQLVETQKVLTEYLKKIDTFETQIKKLNK